MRFHVFGGSQYYPGGGMQDYLGAFTRFDDAMRRLIGGQMGGGCDWGQIATTNDNGELFTLWTVSEGWTSEELRGDYLTAEGR